MSDKQLDALAKDAEKLAKKGELKKAIQTLQSSLEVKKLPTTMLRIAELYLDRFQSDSKPEWLQTAAEYCLRVLRAKPAAEYCTQAEALLKRAGPPARKRAEDLLDAELKADLQKRAGPETQAAIDQLTQAKAAAPAPPPQPAQPAQPSQPPRSATSLADDLFGCRLAPASQPGQALLALPAPGAEQRGAAAYREDALGSMRKIAARLEQLAAANRADECAWIAGVLQRLDEHIRD